MIERTLNMLRIKTGNGIYEVRKPAGRLGAKNMVILSKLASANTPKLANEEGEDPKVIEQMRQVAADRQMELFGKVFEEWADKILPVLIVSGPFTFEEMPGEDQLAVFLALTQETQVAEDFFQVMPAEPSG